VEKARLPIPTSNHDIPKSHQELQYLFIRLDMAPYANGAIDVARLALLWAKFFWNQPSYEVVANLLFKVGVRQDWFELREQQSAAHGMVDLEEEFQSRMIIKNVGGEEPFRCISSNERGEDAVLENIWQSLLHSARTSRRLNEQVQGLASALQNTLRPQNFPDGLGSGELHSCTLDLVNEYHKHLEQSVATILALPTIITGDLSALEDE